MFTNYGHAHNLNPSRNRIFADRYRGYHPRKQGQNNPFFGTLCWIIAFIFPFHGESPEIVQEQLDHNILEIATLWLFLMAAMTFVAYLNSKGFIQNIVHRVMPAQISERRLMFVVGAAAFLFSSISDNITATLISLAVIMSLKLDPKKLIKYATLIVFAVNSGGIVDYR